MTKKTKAPALKPVPPGAAVWLGIDPGAKGCAAFITGNEVLAMIDFKKNPETGFMDIGPLTAAVKFYAPYLATAAVEKPVAYTPNAFAMMALGASFGAALALAQLAGCPVLLPTASKWKRHTNLSKDKKESQAQAQLMFSGLPKRLRADKAEALLLAYYAQVNTKR